MTNTLPEPPSHLNRVQRGEGPDPIDVYVGKRLRQRRVMMGLSQQTLGESLGLTFQQIQKYEKGANRVTAATLYRLAEVMDVPVSFFFDELPRDPTKALRDDGMIKRESLELLRSYYRIDELTRRLIFDVVKAVGGDDSPADAAE